MPIMSRTAEKLSNSLHILKRSVTPWKRYMGFSLGEPERIYNMHVPIMSRTAEKIMSILLYILKRSVTPWKRYMEFSLGEPERIYNMCL